MKSPLAITRGSLAALALLLALASALPLAAELTETELGAFRRPEKDDDVRFGGARAEGELRRISKAASFEKWKTFEDERVKFSYPDDAAISVEVKTDEPVPVGGDRVSSVDTSFSKAYRLVVGGQTMMVFMLQDATWLDDGICLCGEIHYERYLIRGGHLYRFSFLENGVMKKMQVLGAGERLMMFEWTHSPVHPEVYRQMARSVELKRPDTWKEDECRKLVTERYGSMDALGWIDEGAPLESVEAVLGKPTRKEEDGSRVWEKPIKEDGYRRVEKFTLPFKADKLGRFDASYHDSGYESREALRGSLAWMKEVAEPYEEPRVRGEAIKPMPAELKKELLELFLQKAEQPKEDFNGLCQVMKVLVEQGIRDQRALEIVRQRFAADGGHYAAWVLHQAGDPADTALFIDKIKEAYRRARENPKQEVEFDLHNWLAFVPDEDKRYPDLLRQGLGSPSTPVRRIAYFYLDSAPFPEEEKMAQVRTGLTDPEEEVRLWAARCFEDLPMTDKDWELLAEAAEKEKDKHDRDRYDELLNKRKQKKGLEKAK